MILQFEPMMTKDYAKVVYDQIASNWIGFGPRIKEFEDVIAKYVNVKNAIAVSSGTSALLTAMVAIGIGPGSKVIVPNYSFVAAFNVVRFLGAVPIIVDINEETLCLDFREMKKSCAQHDIDAVVFINHNGYVGEKLIEIINFCRKNRIKTIEDAACAIGQWYNGRHAGTFGDIGCFSFSVPKIITTGQGGMLITDNAVLALRCKEIVDQGSLTWRKDGYHKNVGLNFKFNEISAALGLAQFENLDKIFSMRRDNYRRFIDKGLNLHYYPADYENGPWMNVLMGIEAKKTMNKLAKYDIQSKMYYRPIHQNVELDSDDYPIAEKVFKETLYLPSSFNLSIENIDCICDIIGGNDG
jgi:perosamine synthetase